MVQRPQWRAIQSTRHIMWGANVPEFKREG